MVKWILAEALSRNHKRQGCSSDGSKYWRILGLSDEQAYNFEKKAVKIMKLYRVWWYHLFLNHRGSESVTAEAWVHLRFKLISEMISQLKLNWWFYYLIILRGKNEWMNPHNIYSFIQKCVNSYNHSILTDLLKSEEKLCNLQVCSSPNEQS